MLEEEKTCIFPLIKQKNVFFQQKFLNLPFLGSPKN